VYKRQDNEIRAQKAQSVPRGTKKIVEEVTSSEDDEDVGTRKRRRKRSSSPVERAARVLIANFRSSLGTY